MRRAAHVAENRRTFILAHTSHLLCRKAGLLIYVHQKCVRCGMLCIRLRPFILLHRAHCVVLILSLLFSTSKFKGNRLSHCQ